MQARERNFLLTSGIQDVVREFFKEYMLDGFPQEHPHHTLVHRFTIRGLVYALWKDREAETAAIEAIIKEPAVLTEPEGPQSLRSGDFELWGLPHLLRALDVKALSFLRPILASLDEELRPPRALDGEVEVWTALHNPTDLGGPLAAPPTLRLPFTLEMAVHVQVTSEHFEAAANRFTAVILSDVRAACQSRAALPLRVLLRAAATQGPSGGKDESAKVGIGSADSQTSSYNGSAASKTWHPRELEDDAESFVAEVKAAVAQQSEVVFHLLFAPRQCTSRRLERGSHDGAAGDVGSPGDVSSGSGSGGSGALDSACSPVVHVTRLYVLHYRSGRGARSFERPFRSLAEGVFLEGKGLRAYTSLLKVQGKTFLSDGAPAARLKLTRSLATAVAQCRDLDAYRGLIPLLLLLAGVPAAPLPPSSPATTAAADGKAARAHNKAGHSPAPAGEGAVIHAARALADAARVAAGPAARFRRLADSASSILAILSSILEWLDPAAAAVAAPGAPAASGSVSDAAPLRGKHWKADAPLKQRAQTSAAVAAAAATARARARTWAEAAGEAIKRWESEVRHHLLAEEHADVSSLQPLVKTWLKHLEGGFQAALQDFDGSSHLGAAAAAADPAAAAHSAVLKLRGRAASLASALRKISTWLEAVSVSIARDSVTACEEKARAAAALPSPAVGSKGSSTGGPPPKAATAVQQNSKSGAFAHDSAGGVIARECGALLASDAAAAFASEKLHEPKAKRRWFSGREDGAAAPPDANSLDSSMSSLGSSSSTKAQEMSACASWRMQLSAAVEAALRRGCCPEVVALQCSLLRFAVDRRLAEALQDSIRSTLWSGRSVNPHAALAHRLAPHALRDARRRFAAAAVARGEREPTARFVALEQQLLEDGGSGSGSAAVVLPLGMLVDNKGQETASATMTSRQSSGNVNDGNSTNKSKSEDALDRKVPQAAKTSHGPYGVEPGIGGCDATYLRATLQLLQRLKGPQQPPGGGHLGGSFTLSVGVGLCGRPRWHGRFAPPPPTPALLEAVRVTYVEYPQPSQRRKAEDLFLDDALAAVRELHEASPHLVVAVAAGAGRGQWGGGARRTVVSALLKGGTAAARDRLRSLAGGSGGGGGGLGVGGVGAEGKGLAVHMLFQCEPDAAAGLGGAAKTTGAESSVFVFLVLHLCYADAGPRGPDDASQSGSGGGSSGSGWPIDPRWLADGAFAESACCIQLAAALRRQAAGDANWVSAHRRALRRRANEATAAGEHVAAHSAMVACAELEAAAAKQFPPHESLPLPVLAAICRGLAGPVPVMVQARQALRATLLLCSSGGGGGSGSDVSQGAAAFSEESAVGVCDSMQPLPAEPRGKLPAGVVRAQAIWALKTVHRCLTEWPPARFAGAADVIVGRIDALLPALVNRSSGSDSHNRELAAALEQMDRLLRVIQLAVEADEAELRQQEVAKARLDG